MSAQGERRRPGRPRDRSIDVRVLDAARQLLVEQGFDATTVQAVAERSGVHASAIYRRWSSRVDIIEEAIFPTFAPVHSRPTGDLAKDLRRFVRSFVSAFATPVIQAAMPGLLASYQSTGRSGAPETWLAVSARPQLKDILLAASPGSFDPSVDPDDVFDLLMGAVVARSFVPTVAARNRPIERLVELTLRMLGAHELVQPAGG